MINKSELAGWLQTTMIKIIVSKRSAHLTAQKYFDNPIKKTTINHELKSL